MTLYRGLTPGLRLSPYSFGSENNTSELEWPLKTQVTGAAKDGRNYTATPRQKFNNEYKYQRSKEKHISGGYL